MARSACSDPPALARQPQQHRDRDKTRHHDRPRSPAQRDSAMRWLTGNPSDRGQPGNHRRPRHRQLIAAAGQGSRPDRRQTRPALPRPPRCCRQKPRHRPSTGGCGTAAAARSSTGAAGAISERGSSSATDRDREQRHEAAHREHAAPAERRLDRAGNKQRPPRLPRASRGDQRAAARPRRVPMYARPAA